MRGKGQGRVPSWGKGKLGGASNSVKVKAFRARRTQNYNNEGYATAKRRKKIPTPAKMQKKGGGHQPTREHSLSWENRTAKTGPPQKSRREKGLGEGKAAVGKG